MNKGSAKGGQPPPAPRIAAMKRVLDTSEVLGTVETPSGQAELCASALAAYEEETGRLRVDLGASLRSVKPCVGEKPLEAVWLPKAESVTEGVSSEEKLEVARDIFHGWVHKVRQAAPALHA